MGGTDVNLWREMGLEGRRALILHHDDLGITHAQNRAFDDLGYPTGSIMAPAAWAAGLRGRADADLGVHLTLNSEWLQPRLRPLTASPSLRDAEGYFWPTLEDLWRHAEVGEVEAELRAQIDAVRRLGIEPTHLDTHMGAVMRPDIAQVYHRLALEEGLPAMLPAELEYHSLPEAFREPLARLLDASHLPRVHMITAYGLEADAFRDWYLDMLRGMRPGVYHLIHHSAVDTPEGQVLRDWRRRAADYAALRDDEVRRAVADCVLLTYRDVRDALRRHL